MTSRATSYWKQLSIVVICTFLAFLNSTAIASAGGPLEESLLIRINSASGDYEIKGLYSGKPQKVERIAPEGVSQGAFALIQTEAGELLIKPILVRDGGYPEIDVLLPFSKSWRVMEINLVNVPAAPQADWVLKSISIPGDSLVESYARMRNLRQEQASEKLRPGPLLGDCFDTAGGCRLCFFCYEVFGVELCQSPNSYC